MKFIQKLKEHKTAVIFLAIMLVAIFLRTYKFHDWLRFSVDQSRDAKIISSMIEGKSEFPLVGPKAGTTIFLLGPAYYYFSYVAAKIFGNYPDKMAYPSLIFAILSLPLLFLFLREYFNEKISLILFALASVLYVLVINSRFSSNPNLAPFFILLYLYAFLKILNNPQKDNILWSSLAGVALGIGIQLHTTLFVILPIMTIVLIVYFWKQGGTGAWKHFIIIVAVSLLLNTTQFIYELNTDWQNSKNFLAGFQKDSNDGNVGEKVLLISACQIYSNSFIISSLSPFNLDNSKNIDCEKVFRAPSKKLIKSYPYYIYMLVSVLFTVTGYIMLIFNLKKEREQSRKNFLGIVLLFNIIALIVFFPVAQMMHSGYFFILFMVPFIILGLIINLLMAKHNRVKNILIIFVVVLLIYCALQRDFTQAVKFFRGLENNEKGSTLGEIEKMSDYILSISKNNSTIYISGEKELALRYYKPMSYFILKAGIDPILIESNLESVYGADSDEDAIIRQNIPIYYIQKNTASRKSMGQIFKNHKIVASKEFSQQTILTLSD